MLLEDEVGARKKGTGKKKTTDLTDYTTTRNDIRC